MTTREQQETFSGLQLGQLSSAAAGHPSALHGPCPHSPCGSLAGHWCLSAQLSGCSEEACAALPTHTGVGLGLAASSLPSPAAMAGTAVPVVGISAAA